MRSRTRALLSSAFIISVSGCSGAALSNTSPTTPAARSNATIVLSAEQLQNSAGTLLSVLRSRLSGLQVRSSGGSCPEILLRGQKSMFGGNSPMIYVDGTRTANTCVLDMIALTDISRVEVYPMGVAPRPPYKAHPNGLILVFMQNGRE